jgi:hypothetical protein
MEQLLSLIPEAAVTHVQSLLSQSNLSIKITKKRLTKHGDFRRRVDGTSMITLNETSNPYRFLITLLHELAHFKVAESHHYRVKPHGIEWKNAYREIILPFLNPKIFPNPLCSLLALHMKNPKASTDQDFNLVMALRKYDAKTEKVVLYELEDGQLFYLDNGRAFIKMKKRRTRLECKEVESGRLYLFSPHAEVSIPHSTP